MRTGIIERNKRAKRKGGNMKPFEPEIDNQIVQVMGKKVDVIMVIGIVV